jgi:hypothetical protein
MCKVVLRGLDPRIHVFVSMVQSVDGRVKPGQDDISAVIFFILSDLREQCFPASENNG